MGEGGFALIAALWLVVALAALGLEWSLLARERRLAAANLADETRAEGAAAAGLAHARARLEERLLWAGDRSRPIPPEVRADPWAMPGVLLPDTVEIGEARYKVTLRDAGTALHLNRASEEELRRLFAALRVDAGDADRLAQAIADWRDPDDEHRPRGAERDDYLEEGAPVLPDNGPFQRLADLRYVRGMTPEIFERAAPFLTLLGTGQVDLNSAERPVLLSLPGMTDEAVAVLLRLRQQGGRLASLEELPRLLSSGARTALVTEYPRLRARVTLETREVEVLSEGWMTGGPLRVRVEGLFARGGSTTFLVWTRKL